MFGLGQKQCDAGPDAEHGNAEADPDADSEPVIRIDGVPFARRANVAAADRLELRALFRASTPGHPADDESGSAGSEGGISESALRSRVAGCGW